MLSDWHMLHFILFFHLFVLIFEMKLKDANIKVIEIIQCFETNEK